MVRPIGGQFGQCSLDPPAQLGRTRLTFRRSDAHEIVPRWQVAEPFEVTEDFPQTPPGAISANRVPDPSGYGIAHRWLVEDVLATDGVDVVGQHRDAQAPGTRTAARGAQLVELPAPADPLDHTAPVRPTAVGDPCGVDS